MVWNSDLISHEFQTSCHKHSSLFEGTKALSEEHPHKAVSSIKPWKWKNFQVLSRAQGQDVRDALIVKNYFEEIYKLRSTRSRVSRGAKKLDWPYNTWMISRANRDKRNTTWEKMNQTSFTSLRRKGNPRLRSESGFRGHLMSLYHVKDKLGEIKRHVICCPVTKR